MNITATVMAHPKRKAAAKALERQLKKMPFTEVSITWDEKNEEWDTGVRALKRGIERGDWHLVIQDDAILTPDFYENLVGAISVVPERVLISLYTGTARPLKERVQNAVDRAGDCSWLRHYMLMWGVAIVLPSWHIEHLLEFVDTPEWAESQYDNRLGMFYQRNRLCVYYTQPSLVDHDDDIDSLLGHGQSPEPRRAHTLATGRLNWNKRVVDV